MNAIFEGFWKCKSMSHDLQGLFSFYPKAYANKEQYSFLNPIEIGGISPITRPRK